MKSEIFLGIAERLPTGYQGIHLLRRERGEEVEFVTVMWFDSWQAVRAFAGEDYEAAVVPPAARQLHRQRRNGLAKRRLGAASAP